MILELASPVFETLFGLPQGGSDTLDPNSETKDGLQIIPAIQDGTTLANLLRFFYPRPPKLDTIEKIGKVLHAANYYQMDEIVIHLRDILRSQNLLEKHPMRIYAIAWRWGWGDVAKEAALRTLQTELKFDTLPPPDSPEMDEVTASVLLRLFEYHRRCASAMGSLNLEETIPISWNPTSWTRVISGSRPSMPNQCSCANHPSLKVKTASWLYIAKQWWANYVDEICQALEAVPCVHTISKVYSSTKLPNCPPCSEDFQKKIPSFNQLVAERVKFTISTIEVPVPEDISRTSDTDMI